MDRCMDMDRYMDAKLFEKQTKEASEDKDRVLIGYFPRGGVKQQSISIVPVVRCVDCKYYRCELMKFFGILQQSCKLHKGLVVVDRDTFCSYGERKDDLG